MPVYKAVAEHPNFGALGVKPTERIRRYPTRHIPAESRPQDNEYVVVQFAANDPGEAEQYFRKLSAEGCLHDPDRVLNTEAIVSAGVKPWHFRKMPHYVSKAMKRWEIADDRLFAAASKSVETRPLDITLGELCSRYHAAPKPDGVARLLPADATHVSERLKQADKVCEKLVVLATAALSAVEAARAAFGMPAEASYVFLTADEFNRRMDEARAESPPEPKHHRRPKAAD